MESNSSREKCDTEFSNLRYPVVVTHAEVSLKRAPDQAWLSVSTETRDVKADNARRKSAESMSAIQTTLKAVGLSSEDIKTTSYVLTPELEWKNGLGIIKGYKVHNQVEICINDLSRLSDVVDSVNATRDTSITISGLRFSLKNKLEVETEALQIAVKKALSRAQAIATGAQTSLGKILRIEEYPLGVATRHEPFLMQTAVAKRSIGSETPINIGDIEVTVRVTLTAELQ